jgi:hypothetical protein
MENGKIGSETKSKEYIKRDLYKEGESIQTGLRGRGIDRMELNQNPCSYGVVGSVKHRYIIR